MLRFSVTTHLAQDVAKILFLWILPLGLYLLTFVLTFESDSFYQRRLFFQLSAISIAATGYLLVRAKSMPERDTHRHLPCGLAVRVVHDLGRAINGDSARAR